MEKVAVYPGSFDPITAGHSDIIQRLSKIYDEVIVLIAISPEKQSLFTPEEKKELIEKSLPHLNNVRVDFCEGLTVDYMKKNNANIVIRGLRAVIDFEYEMTMASMNKKLAPDIETLLVFASPEYYYISSRGVKEVARHGGDLSGLVLDVVKDALVKKLRTSNPGEAKNVVKKGT